MPHRHIGSSGSVVVSETASEVVIKSAVESISVAEAAVSEVSVSLIGDKAEEVVGSVTDSGTGSAVGAVVGSVAVTEVCAFISSKVML